MYCFVFKMLKVAEPLLVSVGLAVVKGPHPQQAPRSLLQAAFPREKPANSGLVG